ncbi:MAG: hypothetical protein U0414_32055 [Polyangiaceae bacterium]
MSTPNFKLLANALRLGQPPEPLLAFRVLVEVIEKQEAEIAELRQRVSMLTSRLQFTEAKASRVEAASLQALGEPSARTPTFGPPPMHQVEPSPQPAAPPPHGMQIPAMPPIPKEAKKRVDHADLAPIDESDIAIGTLVVARADIDAVVKNVSENEAPFPLSPPGGHRPAVETSGMPFKAARPLDPSGGALKGASPKSASRPPPAIPAAPVIPAAPKIPSKAIPAKVLPRPRPEPSAPYIAIEDMASDDTFSSTSENIRVDAEAPVKPAPTQAPSLLDDGSFDDSAMTILTRRPHGQGH